MAIIQIQISRYTIRKLEEAMKKYNKADSSSCSVNNYEDLIDSILEKYLEK